MELYANSRGWTWLPNFLQHISFCFIDHSVLGGCDWLMNYFLLLL